MNNLKSWQRKVVYLCGVMLLFIPIMWLGRPPEPGPDGKFESGSGGKLAQLRVEYQLGESNMGNVDPASSTMNLLLLGFRGVATSLLWMEAQEHQKVKDWAALRATTNSIILLQPHFLKVWSFEGWNLAYNVSAEWDLIADRYYWVKEGIKFFNKGKDRNEKFPELYWYTGDTVGKKIGRSDEWRQFRQFFRKDPDTVRWPDGPDPAVNKEAKDNYLVARTWFLEADRVLRSPPQNKQHIMDEMLFLQYPSRALMDYAGVLQKEGTFGEVSRVAWEDAFRDWTEKYGNEPIMCPTGQLIKLEISEADLAKIRIADIGKDPQDQLEGWIKKYQDLANYRYWRSLARLESDPTMDQARFELYEGERLWKAADYSQAREMLWSGMTKLEQMLNPVPELMSEDLMIEAAMIAQLFWRECLQLDGEQPNEEEGYPLQQLWNVNTDRLEIVRQEFNRRKRSW
jgi:hypothetical protein